MKFFIEKNFWFKLIVTICIGLTLFNFALPSKVRAESFVSAAGGKLLDPVVDLLLVLGDGVLEVIQQSIMGTGTGLYFDNEKEAWYVTAGKVALAIIFVVAVVVLTGGIAAVIGSVATAIGSSIAAGVISGVVSTVAKGAIVYVAFRAVTATVFPNTVFLPTLYIGPEEIFSGKILLFDVNIFNPKTVHVKFKQNDIEASMSLEDWKKLQKTEDGTGNREFEYAFYTKDGGGDEGGEEVVTSVNNSALELKETIARWYYIIRNVALVALMSVLVYIGIRILISSVAAEKAKYKEMLKDWLVAMCLILLMQYIMVFANTFVESIVNILGNITDNQDHIAVIEGASEKLMDQLKENGMESVIIDKKIYWPTNLMGNMRVLAQQKDGTSGYVGYALCYIVLVLYTFYFSFTYLKRLLYIMFLTIISPLVALTYPIDKVKDGQAQAFNMWLKEYIYNLLIQPFHLLIYVIFVCMAIDLSGTNILYSLVVIGFMIPAEKFLRAMFGFNKASTPGLLAGPAGAAMTISAMKSLAGFAGGKGKKPAGGSGENNGKIKENASTTPDMETKGLNELLGEAGEEVTNIGDRTANINEDENGNRTMQSGGNGDTATDENIDSSEGEGNGERRLNVSNDTADETNGRSESELSNNIPNDTNTSGERRNIRSTMKNFGKNVVRGYKSVPKAEVFKAGASKALRTTSKFAIGGAAAGIGIAAGIATGNPSDVLKYGAAGAFAGSSIGEGLSNRTIDTASKASEKINSYARDMKIGKEDGGLKKYKEAQREKDNQKFMQDKNNRKIFAQELNLKSKEEIDKAMKDACEYRRYDVTDNKLIIKAMKLAGDDTSKRASKENIAAAKLSSVSKSEKDLEARLKQYKRVPGISDEHVQQMEKKIRKLNDM